MGKARFFLTGSLLFLLANFYLDISQADLLWLKNYLLTVWLIFIFCLVAGFLWRYFFWLALIILAGLRFYYFAQAEIATNQNFIFDQNYTYIAEVITLDKKLDGWQIVVAPQNLVNYSGKILLNIPLYPEYHFDDVLEINCQLQQPEIIINEWNRPFFYNKYLAKNRIFATCWRAQIKVIGHSRHWRNLLSGSHQYFWQNLNDYLPEPASSLAKATVLANTREMSQDLRNIFSQTGLSHAIAISGSHITIIIWLLQSLLLVVGLSRQQSFWLLIFILFIYLWLLGFLSSAFRAGVMAVLVLLGPYLGRQTVSVYGLLLTVDILVFLNPYSLVYDIGFQLSFLAVLGLIFYANWWSRLLKFIPNKFKIREMIAMTLAAQVFVWPIIVYYFHIVSVISPLANILVVPFLPLVLILAIGLCFFGWLPLLANLFSWPLFLVLNFITRVTGYLAGVPKAYFMVDNFSGRHLIISLAFMLVLTFILRPHETEIS